MSTFLHQPDIRKLRDEFVGAIRVLAAASSAPPGPMPKDHRRPKLYALNCFGDHSMFSYPYLGGLTRALQHPDLPKLAELVELGGGDLRGLVLTRDADQLLHSTTVTRNFGHLPEQSSMLATNAAVVAAYVSLQTET